MADQLMELIQGTPKVEFTSSAYYDAETDALTFYFSDDPDYGKRLNQRVTAYLSLATNELVGCRIKGVKAALDELGWFDVSISTGKVSLKLLFIAMRKELTEESDLREFYKRLGEVVQRTDVELNIASA